MINQTDVDFVEKYKNRVYEVSKFFYTRGIHRKVETKATSVANKRMPVDLNIGGGSCTDGNKIILGLFEDMVFDPFEEIIATLIALAGHEGQHVRSSSFTEYRKFIEKTGAIYKTRESSIHFWQYIAQHIGNIIEDGRIENILVNRRKGFLPYIKRLRLKLWNDSTVEMHQEPNGEISNYLNAILSYATVGVYPKGFEDVYKNTKLKEETDKVLSLIDEGVLAVDAKSCLDICAKIIEVNHDYLESLYNETADLQDFIQQLIKELLKGGDFKCDPDPNDEEFNNGSSITVRIKIDSNKEDDSEDGSGKSKKDKQNNEKENKSKSGSQKGDKNKNEEKNKANDNQDEDKDGEESKGGSENKQSEDDKSSDEKKENNKENNEDSANSDSNSDSKEGKSNGENSDADSDSNSKSENENSSKENSENSSDGPGSTDIEDMVNDELKSFDDLLEDVKSFVDKEIADENERRRQLPPDINGQEMLSREDFQTLSIPHDPNLHEIDKISKVKDMELLGEPLRDAEKLRKEYEAIIEEKSTYTRNNLKRGRLNNKSLIKLSYKDTRIFTRKGEPYLPNTSITLLMDWSGSMYGEKASYATMAAAKLEHALRGIIPLRIAAFNSGSRITNFFSIKKFDEMSLKKNKSFMFYSQFHPSGSNRDGDAIRIASKELEKRTEENRILIVLSDGLPADYNYDENPILDVHKAIKETRSKGIEVIGIFFGTEREREESKKSYEKMYCYNIISTASENIQFMLKRIIQNII